jgi:hypothetical protein
MCEPACVSVNLYTVDLVYLTHTSIILRLEFLSTVYIIYYEFRTIGRLLRTCDVWFNPGVGPVLNFICVERSGNDYGVSDFCRGSCGAFVDPEAMLLDTVHDRAWAGFYKRTWEEACVGLGVNFYNTDSAYFGDSGKHKTLFRLSVNSYQNLNSIVSRPLDRLQRLTVDTTVIPRGSSIVLVPPDAKTCHRLDLGSVDGWIEGTRAQIAHYTDRPIRVRYRPPHRCDRLRWNSFVDYLREDAWAVVGYSSVALVEAARHSIPVVALGNSAVRSLYSGGLETLEDTAPADQDHLVAWLAHLSYSQFTRQELASGFAWAVISGEI